MGLRKLPDVSTSSTALFQMETDGVENVRRLSRSMVFEGLHANGGSVQSTKGHAGGSAVGLKNY
jgi:hypothetical protein